MSRMNRYKVTAYMPFVVEVEVEAENATVAEWKAIDAIKGMYGDRVITRNLRVEMVG